MDAESPPFAFAMEGMSMALEPATTVRTKSRRLLAYSLVFVCCCVQERCETKHDADCSVATATSRIRSGLERVMMVLLRLGSFPGLLVT